MRRPQSIEKVAERHFFELSLVLPLPLAPGQQNPQSTKTSGFSSVLTHTPRGPSLAPAGQFTLCRQSRMEHKGLRPLINPGVFRQAGAGAHAPACCMPKKGPGSACSAHFGFCGAGFRWAGAGGKGSRRLAGVSAALRLRVCKPADGIAAHKGRGGNHEAGSRPAQRASKALFHREIQRFARFPVHMITIPVGRVGNDFDAA